MARKPNEKPAARGARSPARAAHTVVARPRKAAAAPSAADIEGLRKELASAKARIAALEAANTEVLRRLEVAIETMHSLLES